MAQLLRQNSFQPPDNRIQELEQRVEKLEKMVTMLMKEKNPTFMDFKFLSDDSEKKRIEEESRRNSRISNAMMAQIRNRR